MYNPKPIKSGKLLDLETWEALKKTGFSEEDLLKDQPQGPVIFSYTRKQAIEDGVLVDMTDHPWQRVLEMLGIIAHTVMTSASFAKTVAGEQNRKDPFNQLSRFSIVLAAFREALSKDKQTDRVYFEIKGLDGSPVKLWALIGPGDEGEAVLTLMLENED
ncbi:MAG: hypothetical protein HZA50_13850 [Planctomycetes bacterium]|nr:hypothetical protein [Planctomycetota bacterium]